MEALHKKMNMLLPKTKKERQPGLLRLAYTMLYHYGLRITEMRHLNQKDLKISIEAAQYNLVHHKTKKAHIHLLSKKGVQDLQKLKLEFFILFEKYQ